MNKLNLHDRLILLTMLRFICYAEPQTNDRGNYPDQLNKLYPPPNVSYEDAGEKTENKQKKFLVKVKINLSGVFQNKYPIESRKNEEDSAKQLAQILEISVSANPPSFKGLLNHHCKGDIKPIWMKSLANDESYLFMLTKKLTKAHKVEFEGEWCGSKSDARQSAARKAVKFLEAHELLATRADNSSPSSLVSSPAAAVTDQPSPPSASSQKGVETNTDNASTSNQGF